MEFAKKIKNKNKEMSSAKKSRRLFALSPYYRSQKIADAYSK
jgi:hypothetical protein